MSKTVEEQINVFLCNARESVKAAYLKGYKNGLNGGNINDGTFAAKVREAYNNGLNDAEKAIHLLCLAPDDGGLSCEELERIFEYATISDILKRYTINEIAIRIKEYENRQKKADDEIHVGDEIYQTNSTHKYIVTAFLDNGGIFVLGDDGFTVVFTRDEIHKTGRNYPIKAILKELGNGEE
jgi:hypothetical protein